MKNKKDISDLLSMSYKEIEKELGIKIRNGQTMEGIRKSLRWVQGGDYS